MTTVTTPDGTRLAVEVEGAGPPLLFLHEVAGDLHDWRAQVAHFADRYTCVRYNARGYPPSDVPAAPDSYGQHIAVQDAIAVLDGLGFDAAHVVGLSMGGFCAVHLMLQHPERCLSATVAGAGYGVQVISWTRWSGRTGAVTGPSGERSPSTSAPWPKYESTHAG